MEGDADPRADRRVDSDFDYTVRHVLSKPSFA
jgi:hypothetical protein